MNDDLVNDILNMYKTTNPFQIVMPCPSSRKVVRNDRALHHIESHDVNKDSLESEMDYVKEYKEKDDQEYLQVI